jgi:iron complex transport system substrate-binding protein
VHRSLNIIRHQHPSAGELRQRARAAARVRRSLDVLVDNARVAALTVVLLAAWPARAGELPFVASINLCADQLVLTLAEPHQIRTVSWLAADPEESLLAAEAARYPLNYGSAEELLRFAPDVVIAGSLTNAFTRTLLIRLGYAVVELEPETSVAEIEANVRTVARAINRVERGEAVAAEIRANVQRLEREQPPRALAAVVVRPGGFTVGDHSLGQDLMTLAGVRNVAAEQGLDRWGSLSMETLLRSSPDLIVLTAYRATQPSLANAVLAHPALRRVSATRRSVTIRAPYWACGLPQSLDSADLLQRASAQ